MTDTELVTLLNNIEAGLNGWELDFIDSVTSQVLDEKLELTEKQRAKAEDILERIERRRRC